MSDMGAETIIVRSLTDSDFGIFTAHRKSTRSKQRAIAVTSPIARTLLSSQLYDSGGTEMDVICAYGGIFNRERRHLGKVGKNWRLGGRKLEGSRFGFLDSKDFVVIRSVRDNDGSRPVLMTFVGRQMERLLHAGIGASIGPQFRDSVALIDSKNDLFPALAGIFASVPPGVLLTDQAITVFGDDDLALHSTGSDG